MQSKSGKIKKETTRGQMDYIMDDEIIKYRRKESKGVLSLKRNFVWGNKYFMQKMTNQEHEGNSVFSHLKTLEFLVAEQCYISDQGDLKVLQLSMQMTDTYTFDPTLLNLSGGTGKQSDN